MFFNVRELKKLINDVMRPLSALAGRGRKRRRGRVAPMLRLRELRFAKPRIFINTDSERKRKRERCWYFVFSK